MPTPDPKYFPKPKNKKKTVKSAQSPKKDNSKSFPVVTKRPEAKNSKKSSPFGDNHVWAH